jgi:hypothetical protein
MNKIQKRKLATVANEIYNSSTQANVYTNTTTSSEDTSITPPTTYSTFLLRMPTFNPNGFLKNPSLVSIPRCRNSNSYRLNTVPTISANSISATFLPTHALGP